MSRGRRIGQRSANKDCDTNPRTCACIKVNIGRNEELIPCDMSKLIHFTSAMVWQPTIKDKPKVYDASP